MFKQATGQSLKTGKTYCHACLAWLPGVAIVGFLEGEISRAFPVPAETGRGGGCSLAQSRLGDKMEVGGCSQLCGWIITHTLGQERRRAQGISYLGGRTSARCPRRSRLSFIKAAAVREHICSRSLRWRRRGGARTKGYCCWQQTRTYLIVKRRPGWRMRHSGERVLTRV